MPRAPEQHWIVVELCLVSLLCFLMSLLHQYCCKPWLHNLVCVISRYPHSTATVTYPRTALFLCCTELDSPAVLHLWHTFYTYRVHTSAHIPIQDTCKTRCTPWWYTWAHTLWMLTLPSTAAALCGGFANSSSTLKWIWTEWTCESCWRNKLENWRCKSQKPVIHSKLLYLCPMTLCCLCCVCREGLFSFKLE